MSLVARAFGPSVELPPALAERLAAWRAQPVDEEYTPLPEATFVVVDVESSGLNARRNRLLAIGACRLRGLRLHAGACFERILDQEKLSSEDNVPIHGSAPGEQAVDLAPEQGLMDFLELASRHVLVAYHAPFDRTMLDRATREHLGVRLGNPWIDLADLAPALFPDARLPCAGLDDWLHYFDIRVRARHRAVDDVLATGELFLILLNRARARGVDTIGALLATADAQHRAMTGGRGAGGN
jgi:DNA polymerase-3 subunit epsilon